MADTVTGSGGLSELMKEHQTEGVLKIKEVDDSDGNITSTKSSVPKLVNSDISSDNEDSLTESRLADSALADSNDIVSSKQDNNEQDPNFVEGTLACIPISASESEIDMHTNDSACNVAATFKELQTDMESLTGGVEKTEPSQDDVESILEKDKTDESSISPQKELTDGSESNNISDASHISPQKELTDDSESNNIIHASHISPQKELTNDSESNNISRASHISPQKELTDDSESNDISDASHISPQKELTDDFESISFSDASIISPQKELTDDSESNNISSASHISPQKELTDDFESNNISDASHILPQKELTDDSESNNICDASSISPQGELTEDSESNNISLTINQNENSSFASCTNSDTIISDSDFENGNTESRLSNNGIITESDSAVESECQETKRESTEKFHDELENDEQTVVEKSYTAGGDFQGENIYPNSPQTSADDQTTDDSTNLDTNCSPNCQNSAIDVNEQENSYSTNEESKDDYFSSTGDVLEGEYSSVDISKQRNNGMSNENVKEIKFSVQDESNEDVQNDDATLDNTEMKEGDHISYSHLENFESCIGKEPKNTFTEITSDSDLDISESVLHSKPSLNQSSELLSSVQGSESHHEADSDVSESVQDDSLITDTINRSSYFANKSSPLVLSLETSVSDHESDLVVSYSQLSDKSPEKSENEDKEVILESDLSDEENYTKTDPSVVQREKSPIHSTEKAIANMSLEESSSPVLEDTVKVEDPDPSTVIGSVVLLTDISVLLGSEGADTVKTNSEVEYKPTIHETSIEQDTCIISKEESLNFLKQILHIDEVEELLVHNKLKLLNRIASQWQQIISFNTMMQISRDPLDRCILGVRESVMDILNGWGGLCWSHNVAVHYVLKSLGFHTYLTISAVMDKSELNHTVNIVRSVVEPNDFYTIDIGTGYPSFSAISLDFEHSSSVFQESFVTYKFIKDRDMIRRMHLTTNGKDRAGRQFQDVDEEGWATYFYMWLEEKSVDEVQNILDENVFKDLSFRFNNYILAVKFPNLRLVAIKNNCLMIEDENGHLESTDLDDYEALRNAFSKYFPEIPMNIVENGISNARGLPFEVDKEN